LTAEEVSTALLASELQPNLPAAKEPAQASPKEADQPAAI
jgi:hypothetical protein